jgi:hypothetical protein
MPTEVQIYQDGTIVEADIATGAVTVDKIGAGAVTDVKIGTGAVTVDKIGTGAVTDVKIGAGAVTDVKIGTGAVTDVKIATGAVTDVKIATGAVTPGKLSTGGPSWDTTGNLTANGDITNGGFDFRLGSADQSSRGDSGLSRALVKDVTSVLHINYGGDFTGGTKITGTLSVTGDVTAYSDSDERLKDNITPISNALDKILSISGNTFDWNEKSDKEGNDVGVIAQEILEVLPEAVTTRDTGYLAVRYEKLVPLLIEAIKELKAEVEELKGGK